jgi:hypothetical protein
MTLTARHIHDHLRRVGTWVDWSHTCDGFKAGDPDAPLRAIAVGWQSSQSALEEAHRCGCNLFITHEPTFYSHMDDDEELRASPPAVRKLDFLSETGMAVYRCPDVWMRSRSWALVDAWSEYLGLGQPLAVERYYNLHEVPSTSAWELAHTWRASWRRWATGRAIFRLQVADVTAWRWAPGPSRRAAHGRAGRRRGADHRDGMRWGAMAPGPPTRDCRLSP